MRSILAAGAILAGVLVAGGAQAQQNELVKYCKADIERLCAGVPLGEGRTLKCLKGHPNDISVGCAKALQKLKG